MIKCEQLDIEESSHTLTPDNCTVGSEHGYPLHLTQLVHYFIFKFIIFLIFSLCA